MIARHRPGHRWPTVHGHSAPYASGPTNHEAELAAGYRWRVAGWLCVVGQLVLMGLIIMGASL